MVRIPHYRMGAQAARTLVARLHNRDAPVEHATLRPEAVVRGSTAAAVSPSRRVPARGRGIAAL